ncbi:hypothetical protein GCM10017788_27090 [Amycolatopsis acidiphila]|nr:hypothetical protein GCM10017788_27090 [Amycolatopsis acidiphila]
MVGLLVEGAGMLVPHPPRVLIHPPHPAAGGVLGASFARMQTEVALSALLGRFSHLTPGEPGGRPCYRRGVISRARLRC